MATIHSKKNKYGIIITVLLLIWLLVAVGRSIVNFSKIYTEERYWLNLTYEQKEIKFFGELYTSFIFLKNNTPQNSKILIYLTDGAPYYYGRYLIYPRKIYQASNIDEFQKSIQSYKYVFLYNLKPQELNTVEKLLNGKIIYKREFTNKIILLKL